MEDEKNVEISNLIEFSKIIKDLLNDLINTFPDKTENIILKDEAMVMLMNYDFNKQELDNEEELIRCSTILHMGHVQDAAISDGANEGRQSNSLE